MRFVKVRITGIDACGLSEEPAFEIHGRFHFRPMPFSQRAKIIALAIVKIFETSKPFGDYSAVAVLDDGAGISYGVNQFTHKSGSLFAVLVRFVGLGGKVPTVIGEAMDDFGTGKNILKRSNDKALRTALKSLGKDPLMQQAQREIAFEKYLKPALEAAEGSDFVLPLSLAVIYDSINHGSYGKIRDRVQLELPASIKPIQYEKEWITEYVKKRDAWLESVPRLAKTDYRTDFFLAQIARGNWELNLPLNVHGFKLTEETLFPDSAKAQPDTATDKGVMLTDQPPESSKEPSPDFTEGVRPTGDAPASIVAAPTAVVEVEQVKPEQESTIDTTIKTWGARYVAVPAGVFSFFAAVWGWVTSGPTNVVVALFVVSGVVVIVYIVGKMTVSGLEKARKDRLQDAREARAHEIQKLTLESAMNKDMNTVRVVPQPLVNSDSKEEVVSR